MDILRSILIKTALDLPEERLRILFAAVSSMCGQLTDADALDPKIYAVISYMKQMDKSQLDSFLDTAHSICSAKEAGT